MNVWLRVPPIKRVVPAQAGTCNDLQNRRSTAQITRGPRLPEDDG
jgi:hypothetical protein